MLKSEIIKDKVRILFVSETNCRVFFDSKLLETFKKPQQRHRDLWRRSKLRRFSCKSNVQFWLSSCVGTVINHIISGKGVFKDIIVGVYKILNSISKKGIHFLVHIVIQFRPNYAMKDNKNVFEWLEFLICSLYGRSAFIRNKDLLKSRKIRSYYIKRPKPPKHTSKILNSSLNTSRGFSNVRDGIGTKSEERKNIFRRRS